MSKPEHINKMLEMQKLLQQVQNNKESKKIETVAVSEEVKEEPVDAGLPTKYISSNQLKLSIKDMATSANFLDKLKMTPKEDKELKITEQQASKIRREMVRLTTGTAAVVPLRCKGSQCAFKSTCITGDAIVSGPKDKKMKDLEIGDIIYSFNLDNNRIEKDTVVNKVNNGVKSVYLVTTWYGNKLKVTSDHQFLTVNKNLNKYDWKSIDEGLVKGTKIIIDDVDDVDDDLESIEDVFVDKILDIKKIKEDVVYDITTKKNHNFFANHINVHNCNFYLEGIAPLDEACTVEEELINYWLEKYKNEFSVQEDSITDLHAIGRLVTYDIYEMRLTRYMSENDPTLLVDFVSSFDERGNPISNKTTSAAWDTIDKIDRMRSKTLKELMATREAKTKLIQTVSQAHTNNSLTALREKFESLIKQHSSVTVEGSAVEVG